MGQHEVNIGPQFTAGGAEHVAGQQYLIVGGSMHITTPAGDSARVAALMQAAASGQPAFSAAMSSDPSPDVVAWWSALNSAERLKCWQGWKAARASVLAIAPLL